MLNKQSALTNGERLAIIETETASLKRDVADVKKDIAAVKALLDIIRTDLARYRGAWGAVTMVVVSVWAAITLSKDWVLSHWK